MLYFLISTIALLIISVTMLARANDLRWKKGLVWNTRLVGFVITGVSPVGVIGVWYVMHRNGITPEAVNLFLMFFTGFCVGLAMVFLTTPYLPPWWKWISGKEQAVPQWPEVERRADRLTAMNRKRDEQP